MENEKRNVPSFFRSFATSTNKVFIAWGLWGFLVMTIAMTDIVHNALFHKFQFWVSQAVPSVGKTDGTGVFDPERASAFLAIMWASSPILAYVFGLVPREKIISKSVIDKPTSGRGITSALVYAVVAITALNMTWSRGVFDYWLIGNPIGFSILGSLASAFPWLAYHFLKKWLLISLASNPSEKGE